MNDKDRESIINEAVERALLKVPEVIGNLMTVYAEKTRVSTEFYKKFPEFNNHREIVAATIESVEDADPSKTFQQVIDAATPKIKERIGTMSGLDVDNVKKPSLNFDYKHGEL